MHHQLVLYHFLMIGTDEDALINILPARSNSQRQILRKKYLEMFNKVCKTIFTL